MATVLYMPPNQDFSPPKYDKQASSVADEVALTMGIPQKIVEMARAYQLQTHGRDFQSALQLYTFADDLVNDLQKQHEIGKKISESEQALKKKEEEKNEKKKTDHKHLARTKEVLEVGAVVKSEAAARDVAAEMQQKSLAVDHEADVAQHQQQPATTKKTEEDEEEVKVKAPLKEKVRRLAKENHRLRQRKLCRKCKEVDLATSGVTFLPCGHFITCETCCDAYQDCPACGKGIMGTVRTFLS